MSYETKVALDEALAAHIASESDGAMVTGYALLASTITLAQVEEHKTGYFREYAENQPMHIAIGLVAMHLRDLQFPETDHD